MPLNGHTEMPSDSIAYAVSVSAMAIGQTFNQY